MAMPSSERRSPRRSSDGEPRRRRSSEEPRRSRGSRESRESGGRRRRGSGEPRKEDRGGRRSHSAPPTSGTRSCLRVKSQTQSLQKRGLTGEGRKSNVGFACLEVREYPMVLGDNPSVMEGPPITIDWAHDPTTQFVLDVNTFERMRGRRRTAIELVMPKEVRERWLLNTGTSRKEIAQAVRQCRKEKHLRMVSCHNQHMDGVSESLESATSGIKKLFVFKKSAYDKSLSAAAAAAEQTVGARSA